MWAAVKLAILPILSLSISPNLCLCLCLGLSPPTSTENPISFRAHSYCPLFTPSRSLVLETAITGSPHDELTYWTLSFFKVTSWVWAAWHLTHTPDLINTFPAQTIQSCSPELWAVNKADETRKGCWLTDKFGQHNHSYLAFFHGGK